MSKKLRTEISHAFWCNPKRNYCFESAVLGSVMRGDPAKGTCWFDELFEGGIVLPDTEGNKPRALTILLSGPPGSGKSTLAMEFCYRAALSEDIQPSGLRSHYITVEAHRPWIIDNARSFGWSGIENVFGAAGEERQPIQIVPAPSVADMIQWASQEPAAPYELISRLARFFGYPGYPDPKHLVAGEQTEDVRDILVIDSLNTIQGDKAELFSRLMSLVLCGHKIIVLILDSSPHMGPQVWDFAADIVIRLDRDYSSGYLIRTLEIVKARYQPHVWGKHQLKVYEPFERNEGELNYDDKVRYLRAHPYREEGGIFIFPSIHYVLSRYKTKSPPGRPEPVPCAIPELTKLLDGGLPLGRCVGLVGGRGTHKSHLGYMHILSRVLGPPYNEAGQPPAGANESALIVSLRDDEGTTRATLEGILVDHYDRLKQLAVSDLLDELEAEGRLEITYYPPGFITPEEFFHRLLLSINRLKASSNQVTVLFNSLDQLSSRFPLCAEQKIFIPGIIQMLSAEEVTTIFVAAHEENADPEYYGLLSMAELILSLEREVVKRSDYLPWIMSWFHPKVPKKEVEQAAPEELYTVRLQVVRFAGGQPAGATGILELVKPDHWFSKLFGQSGLVFIPCAERTIQNEDTERYLHDKICQ